MQIEMECIGVCTPGKSGIRHNTDYDTADFAKIRAKRERASWATGELGGSRESMYRCGKTRRGRRFPRFEKRAADSKRKEE